MEILLLLLLVVLAIIVLNRQAEGRELLSHQLHDLTQQITAVQKKLGELKQQPPVTAPPPAMPSGKPEERPVPEPIKLPTITPPPLQPVMPPAPAKLQTPEPTEEERERRKAEAAKQRAYEEELRQKYKIAEVSPPPSEGWYDKWVRNNPDLEKFIGENLANKIGIAVLVLGIAFFVKYAIDKDWIKEGGRIAIGLLCGGILTGVAHYLRNSYRSFSSVLVGGGLCVFYFTIAFAFQEYGMMPQSVAFGAMVIITAFAVVLSLLYNRIELAVLATIGGFVTPFLVSTGNANYMALFTYLSILNAGLLVLSYFKRWPAINIIALFFTVIIFGGWLGISYGEPAFSYRTALFFATLFYLLFIASNTLNNLREGRVFKAFDFSILLSINALYYAAGIIILSDVQDGAYKGLFTAVLGVLNLGMAYFLFRKKQVDKNFIYLLIGLTLTYISLAAPVQLNGNNITLFWAAELVLLYWLYLRSGIALLKIAAGIISVLSLLSLAMDLQQTYNGQMLPVLFNRAFITIVVVAVAHVLFYIGVKKSGDEKYVRGLPNRLVITALPVLFTGLFYAAGALEIQYQFRERMPESGAGFIYLQLYTFCFALGILLLALQRFSTNILVVRNLILLACFGLYLLYISPISNASRTLLSAGGGSLFAGHWLADLIFLAIAFFAVQWVRKNSLSLKHFPVNFTWILSIALVIFFSVETGYVFMWASYTGTEDSIGKLSAMYSKAGITITWAVLSFALMWLGMRHRYKTLRVVSLSLFCGALLKLFLWDIRNIGEGGKIAAFIMLGVLLLIISFMYQRLKKLFANDEAAGK